jgi:hypothetical protein
MHTFGSCSLSSLPSMTTRSMLRVFMPTDFHSQNIMVTDVDSVLRIMAVIDWEFSSTAATSSFRQYSLFIVDHPQWVDDHPLRSRNLRDQAKFNVFMNEAEGRREPDGGH